jgi:hypothetical protein
VVKCGQVEVIGAQYSFSEQAVIETHTQVLTEYRLSTGDQYVNCPVNCESQVLITVCEKYCSLSM